MKNHTFLSPRDRGLQQVLSGGDFDWSEATQGTIQGSLFYGYILSHALGGLLVQRLGGKQLMAAGMLFSSAVTMATPLAAHLGAFTMVLCRAFIGLGLGVLIPGCYSLMAAWSPPQERALHLALMSAGMNLGTVVTLPASAWLCERPVDSAWALVFYLTGCLGFVWSVGWYWVLSDNPASHPRISPWEVAYIQQGCHVRSKTPPHPPWGQIVTSGPVWVAAFTSFCSSWTFYTMLTELPTYLSRILHSSMLQVLQLHSYGQHLSL
ncbi:hypothetical protein LAZ67_3006219 [Cordylochernes scorpioides]|uniref:Major facilitator superfamily (MFS) profile domain-containing protein n=1 Tax=Cordylochernes scorpioides TaxID=51811 RepID=A0ABY6KCB5_9ARAC|nr:hypothetical protein LAZ67_3006219 [Cordylochernes scorpioides]